MRDSVSSLLALAALAELTCCSSSPIRAQYSVTVLRSASTSPSSAPSRLRASSARALRSSMTTSFDLTSSVSSLTRTDASSLARSSSLVAPSFSSSWRTLLFACSSSLFLRWASLVSSDTRDCRLPMACFDSCPSRRASAFLVLSESMAPFSSLLCSSCCCRASSSVLLFAVAAMSPEMRLISDWFSCLAAASSRLASSGLTERSWSSSSCILALSARRLSDSSLASSNRALHLSSAFSLASLASCTICPPCATLRLRASFSCLSAASAC
mmetsp:Transcript_17284/g.43539  ORF Transcript_17284/g.43539 Transcript_17284/m.43539 type:complete len:270 (-) Transcript_17284:160-969(-)